MSKLRSTRRNIAMAATTLALVSGATVGAASSASANVHRASTCVAGDGTVKIWLGSASQCFYWTASPPGNYLNVNDWYDGVFAGSFTVDVEWHDLVTGRWFPNTIYRNETVNQPTSDSVLYSITFRS